MTETPERCCLFCKWSIVKSGGMIVCNCDESLYFEDMRNKKQCCPDFQKEKKGE